MLRLTSKGDYKKTIDQLKKAASRRSYSGLDKFGKAGVDALASATPVDTGLTAGSWKYRIITGKQGPSIEWYNTNTRSGVSVAILIQYGHGTGTGGYVQGKDYVNPAMRPVFDKIANDFWKEVASWRA